MVATLVPESRIRAEKSLYMYKPCRLGKWPQSLYMYKLFQTGKGRMSADV